MPLLCSPTYYFIAFFPCRAVHLSLRFLPSADLSTQVEFYRENTLINDNIMENCRINKVKKLVSFLSTCIFPDKTTYPIDETMLHPYSSA